MRWTDELIEKELFKSIKVLGLERMPTGEELKSIGRNDLHCKVSRTKKYSGWAAALGLELKRSDTLTGQEWETTMANLLEGYGFEVEIMTTKHPYDLLIDGVVKVDVKVANPYLLRGIHRTHTFNLSKNKPTCDIYILTAKDEKGEAERILVIPSHLVQQVTVSIGMNSKYNKYKDNWNVISEYSQFINRIT